MHISAGLSLNPGSNFAPLLVAESHFFNRFLAILAGMRVIIVGALVSRLVMGLMISRRVAVDYRSLPRMNSVWSLPSADYSDSCSLLNQNISAESKPQPRGKTSFA